MEDEIRHNQCFSCGVLYGPGYLAMYSVKRSGVNICSDCEASLIRRGYLLVGSWGNIEQFLLPDKSDGLIPVSLDRPGLLKWIRLHQEDADEALKFLQSKIKPDVPFAVKTFKFTHNKETERDGYRDSEWQELQAIQKLVSSAQQGAPTASNNDMGMDNTQ